MKTSTAQMTSSLPSESSSSDWARGTEVHEVRVALGDAEGQGAGPAALVELLEGVSGPGLGGDVSGELLLVEAGVAPGDVPIVHLVRDAEVPEAAEEVLLDALHEVAAVDEVLLAQGQEVAPVGAFRGGGEAEQELRAEVVDEAPVGRGRGVVELVHDDVVEAVAREALEVGDAAEGLDRRKEDVGVCFPLLAHVEAQSGVGPDPPEGVPGLLQDLLAVRNEEDVAELGAVGVARTTRPAVLPCARVSSSAFFAACWMGWGVGIVAGSSRSSTGPRVHLASGVGRRWR